MEGFKKISPKFLYIVGGLFLLYMLFFSSTTIVDFGKAVAERARVEKEISKYEKEIEDMDARIEALTGNKDTLETFAREHFHLVEPGDEVYLLEE